MGTSAVALVPREGSSDAERLLIELEEMRLDGEVVEEEGLGARHWGVGSELVEAERRGEVGCRRNMVL